mmetsp:Transcript_13763/g.32349  ORF Transcript_13763/g.32349 Transcript_13763/m.32349 type:complete len:221 (+) Transcript_13763:590-1252(+)
MSDESMPCIPSTGSTPLLSFTLTPGWIVLARASSSMRSVVTCPETTPGDVGVLKLISSFRPSVELMYWPPTTPTASDATFFRGWSSGRFTNRTRVPFATGPCHVSKGMISTGSSASNGASPSAMKASSTATVRPCASRLLEICLESFLGCPLATGVGPVSIVSRKLAFSSSSSCHPLLVQEWTPCGGNRAGINFGFKVESQKVSKGAFLAASLSTDNTTV